MYLGCGAFVYTTNAIKKNPLLYHTKAWVVKTIWEAQDARGRGVGGKDAHARAGGIPLSPNLAKTKGIFGPHSPLKNIHTRHKKDS